MGEVIVEATAGEGQDVASKLVQTRVRTNRVNDKGDIDLYDSRVNRDESSVVNKLDVPRASGRHSIKGAIDLRIGGHNGVAGTVDVGELDDDIFSGQASADNGDVDIARQTLCGNDLVGVDVGVVTVEVGADCVNSVDCDGNLRLLNISVHELERHGLKEEILAILTHSAPVKSHVNSIERVRLRGSDLTLRNVAMVVLEDNV